MGRFESAAGTVVVAVLLAVGPASLGDTAEAAGHDGPVHAHRVKDINPGSGDADVGELVVMGGHLYFVADDGVDGRELWRSNGTAIGTRLVANITGDGSSSHPSGLTVVGDHVYFSADDGVHGRELWRSDGTAPGTHLVRDIRPGAADSHPGNLAAVGRTLYFSADDGLNGREPWRSDATTGDTELVRDVNPGAGSSNPTQFTSVGGVVFFSADDGVHGGELWRTNGTMAGTNLVRDIWAAPGVSSFISNMTVFKGMLHFRARSQNVGTEVWRSDGTQAGTQAVTDINLGPTNSDPTLLTVVGDYLYFSADGAGLGRELWRTSGGVAADGLWELVHDVQPGAGGSSPAELVAVGDRLYFTADDGIHGRELWRTDVNGLGAELVKDIRPGAGASPQDLTPLGGFVYFNAHDGVHGRELWRSDGAGAGTHLVADIHPGGGDSLPRSMAVLAGDLYFVADDGIAGSELWRVTALPDTGVVRYGGPSRYETAVLLSEARFEPGVDAVYVATGLDFPDAMTGAVAAALDHAPVLLVTRDDLPAATRAELERLQPGRIWILGGQAVVGPGVEAELADYTAGPVSRLSGPDRYATAAAVSAHSFPGGADVAYVTTGLNFPDALTGVPAGAAAPGPLLLVTADQIPQATAAELARLGLERVVILGGQAAVGDAVAQALGAHADVVHRISGPDRFATAAAIAEETFPEPEAVRTVFVATGSDFPDALAAGAVAGAIPGPVLLSHGSGLPDPTIAQLERFRPHQIVVMGGTAAISAAVEAQLAGYLAD